MAESTHHSISEQPTRAELAEKRSRRSLRGAAGIVAVASVFSAGHAGGGCAPPRQMSETDWQKYSEKYEAAVIEDGFPGTETTWEHGRKKIALKLGSCTLEDAQMELITDQEGYPSGITEYKSALGTSGVSFSFDNMNELRELVKDSDPCKVIASRGIASATTTEQG